MPLQVLAASTPCLAAGPAQEEVARGGKAEDGGQLKGRLPGGWEGEMETQDKGFQGRERGNSRGVGKGHALCKSLQVPCLSYT